MYSWHLFQRNQSLCLHRGPCKVVCSSFVHGGPYGMAQMPFNKWTFCQSISWNTAQPWKRMNYWYMPHDETLEKYTGWKKLIPKEYILDYSTYIRLLKWQNDRTDWWFPEFKERLGWEIGYATHEFKWGTWGWSKCCVVTMSMSLSWLWYYSIIFQGITFEGNWVKSTWDFPLFLQPLVNANLSQTKSLF